MKSNEGFYDIKYAIPQKAVDAAKAALAQAFKLNVFRGREEEGENFLEEIFSRELPTLGALSAALTQGKEKLPTHFSGNALRLKRLAYDRCQKVAMETAINNGGLSAMLQAGLRRDGYEL